MKNRLSSFPVEGASSVWYRELWPWLLIAGPAIVVVASLATAWIAVRSDDGLVAPDYYKRGLLINRLLPAGPMVEALPAPTIALSDVGEIRLRGSGTVQRDSLKITLRRPATSTTQQVTLVKDPTGDFVGILPADRGGRWTVSFDTRETTLPTMLLERKAR